MNARNLNPDVDVVCGDCGKRLHGWSYRPMFVQCDDCASLDQAPDPDAFASAIHQRMVDTYRQSGLNLQQLEAKTGIGPDRLGELFDSRDIATVSELVVIAAVCGCNASDWFRLADAHSEVGQ